MTPRSDRRPTRGIRLLSCALVLVGLALCGTARAQDAQTAVDDDPWESFNRKMFWFNDQIDTYFLAPVATGWDWVTPDPVQVWVGNFFDNLNFPIVTVNALLQGKPKDAGIGLARFLFNTTVGFAGFFDPASSELGLGKIREDFGQTLAVWGLGSGPFLVLPFLGPTTPRDAVGTGVDGAMAVYPWIIPAVYTYGSRAVDLVNTRSRLLEQIEASRKSSFDYYVFVRNAYLQYRRNLINDQEGPRAGMYEDLYDVVPGN
jgi:phospholipid-binding lipoprotein MlaA